MTSGLPSGNDSPTLRPTTPAPPDGLQLRPFRALRYAEGEVAAAGLAALTSPPYDVIDEAGVTALEQASEHNIVRLILPRGDADSRYAAAAATLNAWLEQGVLVRDDEPALWVYEIRQADGHEVRGLLGAVGLVPPDAGVILPHENTMAGPVADRLALTRATAANLEPILLVYDGGDTANAVMEAAAASPPVLEGRTDDGAGHRLWRLSDAAEIERLAADLQPRRAVIADGHHRYATYLQFQADRHAEGAGSGPWDFGLAMLIDARRYAPQVHGIHRVIPSLPYDEAVELAQTVFAVEPMSAGPADAVDVLAARGDAAFVITDGTRAHLLTAPDPDELADAVRDVASPAVRALDVTIAHSLLIARVWGVADTADVVGYRHSVDEALAAVADGGTALLLRPTPVADVLAVAADGQRMPRKSTLFTPKPRTGLVFRDYAAG